MEDMVDKEDMLDMEEIVTGDRQTLAIIIFFATCWTLLHPHSSLLAQCHQLLKLLLAHLPVPVVVKLLENDIDLLFCHLLWNLDYWWRSKYKYVCSKAMDSPPSKQCNYQLAHYWCNQQVMVTLENSALVINPSLSLSNNLKAVSAELIPSISSETNLLYLSRPISPNKYPERIVEPKALPTQQMFTLLVDFFTFLFQQVIQMTPPSGLHKLCYPTIGIGARGVSSEHVENMDMFSCSPT